MNMRSNSPVARLIRLKAIQRLAVAASTGLAVFMVQTWDLLPTRLIVSWDVGVIVYLAMAWLVVVHADAGMTREQTLSQDQSGYLMFLIVVCAACASIVAIGFTLAPIKDLTFWPKAWHLALSITALISSWLLIQTVFAFHYARRYYGAKQRDRSADAPLLFPGDRQPDYMDFAYYAFVVGMTSQVSDVAVNSRQMRRLTLVHGTLAFVFNMAVLALSINIIASVI
ncbi:MAG: DUF1345 domain-containing protein [Pseudomonadota bacterium]